ncbi:MAG: hypothetical protein IT204_12040 [Fimbriimonadaceae bacterium]|nr:hypothetical protein [Fimbriimonadaceae bacterium]
MADVTGLVKEIAERLGGSAQQEEDDTWSLEILDGEEVVSQVTIYSDRIDEGPAEGRELLVVRAAAGELEESIETFLAEEAAGTWFSRVYLEDDGDGDGDGRPVVIVEAAMPLEGLSVALAHHAVLEVVDLVEHAQDFVIEYDEDEEE